MAGSLLAEDIRSKGNSLGNVKSKINGKHVVLWSVWSVHVQWLQVMQLLL